MQEQQPRKWLKIVILAASSLVFLGLSIIPIVGGLMQNQRSGSQSSPNPAIAGGPTDPKELQETEKNYLAVLQREANNLQALEGLITTRQQLVKLGQRKPKDVTDPLEDFVKRQPTNVNVLSALSKLLVEQQRGTDAVAILEQSLEVAKQDSSKPSANNDPVAIELLLGEIYLAQKQPNQASAIFEQLSQQNPQDYRPVLSKGMMLHAEGKQAAALTQLQSALALAPEQSKPNVQAIIDVVKQPPGATPSPPPSQK